MELNTLNDVGVPATVESRGFDTEVQQMCFIAIAVRVLVDNLDGHFGPNQVMLGVEDLRAITSL